MIENAYIHFFERKKKSITGSDLISLSSPHLKGLMTNCSE